MHRALIIFSVIVALAFSGCGTRRNERYGNFAGVESVDIVNDALEQLIALYPPAKTRINLMQPADDAFGKALLGCMRDRGYAVSEYAAPAKAKVKEAVDNKVLDKAPGYEFGYVIDEFLPEMELWVTLHVGQQTLSRMYAKSGGRTYTPLGVWSRRN